jgi:hypothetical protein
MTNVLVPEPVAVQVDDSEFENYERVANELKFENVASLRERLLRFFSREGILVYPFDQVAAFLTAKKPVFDFIGDPIVWVWKPLRKEDMGKLTNFGGIHNEHFVEKKVSLWKKILEGEWYWRRQIPSDGQISQGQYGLKVPYPVLLTAQKVAAAFPQVHFYVSDYESRNPDPFLAVTAVGMEFLVIEHWDEPDFLLKK